MSVGGGESASGAMAWSARATPQAAASIHVRRRRRWRIATAVCLFYAGCIVLWQTARYTPVATWPPFELLDIFGLALFAPLPPLLLATLLLGNRRAGLWLLLPLAVLAWEVGPLVLPRPIPRAPALSAPPAGRPLRVMTANLLWINEQRAATAALLGVERPDVVVIQELGPAMADFLASELRGQYPHQLLEPSSSAAGLGILSRYPFRTEIGGDGRLPRECYCQRVVVDVGGRPATVLNLHPWPPRIGLIQAGRFPVPTTFDASQTTQAIRAALAGARQHEGALLVLGDLNTSARQPLYRELARDLRDAQQEAGRGLGHTFPAVGVAGLPAIPFMRIDYVWYDPSVRAWAARTGTIAGSDHQYVIADLLLP
jgi:vancomycin resistance protein VanJ